MVAADVKMGQDVVVYHPHLVNLYGCEIGDGCKIGAFVEIRRTAKIGRNVKIQAFAFIPEGITLEDGVFIGPHVCFTNDKHPRAVNADGSLMSGNDWEIIPTLVNRSQRDHPLRYHDWRACPGRSGLGGHPRRTAFCVGRRVAGSGGRKR